MFSHPQKTIKEGYIAEGMIVADFGAGTGHHSLAIARQVGESGAVYAIEVQKDLLEKLQNEASNEKLLNIHPILADLERPGSSKLADQFVDRVLIANTLFQLDEKNTPLLEAKRILKSDGKLILIDWQDSFGNIGPHKDQVVTKEMAQSIAEKAGFKLEKEIDAGSHHYGMLFQISK